MPDTCTELSRAPLAPLEAERFEAVTLSFDTSPEAGFVGPGIALVDLRGDTWLDLVRVRPKGWGVWFEHDATGQLERRGELPGGAGVSAADIEGDGDLDLVIVGLYGDWVGWNDGTGELDLQPLVEDAWPVAGSAARWADVDEERAPELTSADPSVTKTIVVGDIDQDGRPDLVTASTDFVAVYRNSKGRPGATIRLHDPGVLNHAAWGARVEARLGERSLVRWMLPSSQGSHSVGPAELSFGLGSADRVDGFRVTWPDGQTTEHGAVEAGERVTLERQEP